MATNGSRARSSLRLMASRRGPASRQAATQARPFAIWSGDQSARADRRGSMSQSYRARRCSCPSDDGKSCLRRVQRRSLCCSKLGAVSLRHHEQKPRDRYGRVPPGRDAADRPPRSLTDPVQFHFTVLQFDDERYLLRRRERAVTGVPLGLGGPTPRVIAHRLYRATSSARSASSTAPAARSRSARSARRVELAPGSIHDATR